MPVRVPYFRWHHDDTRSCRLSRLLIVFFASRRTTGVLECGVPGGVCQCTSWYTEQVSCWILVTLYRAQLPFLQIALGRTLSVSFLSYDGNGVAEYLVKTLTEQSSSLISSTWS